MDYESWVETWQQQQLNDNLLRIYGPEDDEDYEEFDEIEYWPEPENEEK